MELNLVTWNVNGIRTRIFDNEKVTNCKLNKKTLTENSIFEGFLLRFLLL